MAKNPERKEFLLPSDLAEVSRASEQVLLYLEPMALSEAMRFDIRLCLEEAVINAMKYGNELRRDRHVRIEVEHAGDELRFTVEDQGKGFDPKKLKNCTDEENRLANHGRGVYLIHQLMDKVQYNEKGNRLLMVKNLKNQSAPRR